MRRAIFIIVLFGVINIFTAARIIYRWPWAEDHVIGAWIFVLVFFVVQLIAPLGDHSFLGRLRKKPHMKGIVSLIDWISYVAFGIMSLLVVYGLAIDFIGILLQLFCKNFNPDIFDGYALYAIFFATLGTTFVAMVNVWRGPQVKEVDIALKNLPQEFEGFKIAQVSDLHVGSAIQRRYVQNVVNIVNHLKPDLIALTGDFVDGSVEGLFHDVAPLASLHAPEGVFFVSGNHEYYSGIHAWLDMFGKLGMRILLNEHVTIKRGAAAFILAGVTDYAAGRMVPGHASDPAKALRGAPPGLVKILLAHQPISYRGASKAGFDLQLSGHTHNGQYFPYTFIIRFFQHFYRGLNHYNGLQIYINRGTGYWGPPFRTRPSEITLIKLRRQG